MKIEEKIDFGFKEKAILFLGVLYLSTFLFEGLLRFALTLLKIQIIIYFREIVPPIIILYLLFLMVNGSRIVIWPLILFVILLFHVFVGFYFLGNKIQPLLGLKPFLAIIVGISISFYFNEFKNNLGRTAFFILIISILGVLINKLIVYPWEGQEFISALGISEASKVWSAYGIRRLSGLSRASYDVASVILVSLIAYMSFSKKSWAMAIVWVIAGVAIGLTTTKGAMAAWFATGIFSVISLFGVRRNVLRLWLLLSFIICTTIPLVTTLLGVSTKNFSGTMAWWLGSFGDRTEATWPDAFSLLVNKGSLLFGRGLGGIGTPQLSGEINLQNPGDNLFVYLLVVFGLLGIIYLSWCLLSLIRWKNTNSNLTFLFYGISSSYFIYGLTANMVEQPVMTISMGFVLGLSLARNFGKPNGILPVKTDMQSNSKL